MVLESLNPIFLGKFSLVLSTLLLWGGRNGKPFLCLICITINFFGARLGISDVVCAEIISYTKSLKYLS